MFNKKIVFLLSFISIAFSNQQNILNILKDWDQYEISIDGMVYDCPLCIPYKIKSNNNTITISIPRIYNNTKAIGTFLVLNTKYPPDLFWELWPADSYIYTEAKNAPIRIYSVMGYDIDSSQNYYLLDQGVILQENNTIMQNTSKLLIFNKDRGLKKIFFFEDPDYINSFLTDIMVDQSQDYAYIVDSGNLLNNQSFPRIIVIDLEKEKIYKILNNNIYFKPDENVSIIYSENEIYNYFTNITGLNNIQISCDGEMVFLSSLKSKNILRIYTKDILKAIKNYEKTNDEKYLNNIDITIVDKGFISQSFYISSKNNIYMTNGDNGTIQALYKIDEDLTNFNFTDFSEIKSEKFVINWPASVDVDNGKIYVLDNHYYFTEHNYTNYTVGNFVIYVGDLDNDEISHKSGCSIYYLKLNALTIILGIWFLFIFIIVIFVMIINREIYNRQIHKKDNINKKKNENENIIELNRKLNEENDDD